MDVLAHGLWSGAPFYKKENRPRYWLAFLFGVLPDVLAFAPQFIIFFLNPGIRPKFTEPPSAESIQPFTYILYNITHSLVIFCAVFLAIYFIRKRRPLWEMWGWGFHILCDIPTHTYKFFPTPFLWPISDIKFSGFSWGQPWFIALNYVAIVTVYIVFSRLNKAKK